MNLFYGLSRFMRYCEVCRCDPKTNEFELLISNISMLIQPYDISQHQLPETTGSMTPESDADFRIFVKEEGAVNKLNSTHLITYRKSKKKPPFHSKANSGKYLKPDGTTSTDDVSNPNQVVLPVERFEDDTPVFSIELGSDGNPVSCPMDNPIPKPIDTRNLTVRRVLDSISGYVEIWANVHSMGEIGHITNVPGESGRLI